MDSSLKKYELIDHPTFSIIKKKIFDHLKHELNLNFDVEILFNV